MVSTDDWLTTESGSHSKDVPFTPPLSHKHNTHSMLLHLSKCFKLTNPNSSRNIEQAHPGPIWLWSRDVEYPLKHAQAVHLTSYRTCHKDVANSNHSCGGGGGTRFRGGVERTLLNRIGLANQPRGSSMSQCVIMRGCMCVTSWASSHLCLPIDEWVIRWSSREKDLISSCRLDGYEKSINAKAFYLSSDCSIYSKSI